MQKILDTIRSFFSKEDSSIPDLAVGSLPALPAEKPRHDFRQQDVNMLSTLLEETTKVPEIPDALPSEQATTTRNIEAFLSRFNDDYADRLIATVLEMHPQHQALLENARSRLEDRQSLEDMPTQFNLEVPLPSQVEITLPSPLFPPVQETAFTPEPSSTEAAFPLTEAMITSPAAANYTSRIPTPPSISTEFPEDDTVDEPAQSYPSSARRAAALLGANHRPRTR